MGTRLPSLKLGIQAFCFLGALGSLSACKVSVRSDALGISKSTSSASTGPVTATQLSISTTPSLSGNTDSALGTQPVVTAQNASAVTATTYAGTITFTAFSDNSCSTVVASGLNSGTPTNTSGVVSFAGIKILKTNVVAIKATDGSLTSACLNGFTISPGALNSLSFSTQASAAPTSGSTFAQQPVVTAYDANSNTLGAGTAITLSLTSGAPTLSCTTNPVSTNASGIATFAGCKLTGTTGVYTLTATSGAKTVVSSNITLGAGATSQLTFNAGPTTTGDTDTALTAQPNISAKDASGNVVPAYAGTITFTGYSDAGCTVPVASGMNSGTPSNASGVISFSGVKILKTNVHSMNASDGTFTTICLNGYTISPGALNSLTFSTQPSATATTGTNFTQQPVVTAYDANSNALAAGTAITLSLTSGAPTLSCTTNPVSTNASGVSTFAGCKLTGTVGSYTLTATSGAKTVVSNSITLAAGAASQLIFSTSPSSTGNTDTALSTQPQVTAADASANTISSYAGTITFTGYSDTSCTTTVATSINSGTPSNASGVVSFSGVKILKTSVVAIKATDGTLSSSCLSGFTISPGALNTLTFSTQPTSNVISGVNFVQQPSVSAFDANSNALSAGTAITLSLTSGAPTLSCTTNPVTTNASGISTFAGCKLTGTNGAYTLTATSGAKTVVSTSVTIAATAQMLIAHAMHTQITLPSGKVLVIAGLSGGANTAAVEFYDPATNTWANTGSLTTARRQQGSALLSNGKVIAMGGYGAAAPLASSEIFDPSLGTWSAGASLNTARYAFQTTVLSDGKVLVAGGIDSAGTRLSSVEVYDPSANTWTTKTPMNSIRQAFTTTLLSDGTVLATGGYSGGAILATTEIYDPTANTWTNKASMPAVRTNQTALKVSSTKVIVVGGQDGAWNSTNTIFLYDTSANTWSTVGTTLVSQTTLLFAELLNTGNVLIGAGFNVQTNLDLATTNLYSVSGNSVASSNSMSQVRTNLGEGQLSSGAVIITGGTINVSNTTTNSVEIFEPSTSLWH